MRRILENTYHHARNLGSFVLVYKTLMTVLKKAFGPHKVHAFIAAFLGGWLVFGKNNNINMQVRCPPPCDVRCCLFHCCGASANPFVPPCRCRTLCRDTIAPTADQPLPAVEDLDWFLENGG